MQGRLKKLTSAVVSLVFFAPISGASESTSTGGARVYSQAEVNSLIAQQSRLEALQMLDLISSINGGDIKSVCNFAEMSLRSNRMIIGGDGVDVTDASDERRNESVSRKIDDYFKSGAGCHPRKKGDGS